MPLFGTTARTPKVTQRVVSRLAKDVEDQEEENEQRADGFSSAEATSVDENAPGKLTMKQFLFTSSNPCILSYLVIYIAPLRTSQR